MEFKLCGIKFEISYIFLCAVTVFIATDKTGIYIPLFVSVIAHELAHTIILLLFNIRIKAIRLIVGSIGIEYDGSESRVERITSLVAGPLANALLAVLGYFFSNRLFFAVNLILAVYNLLPIKGLDGGSILQTLLSGAISEKKINFILNTIAVFISTFMFMLFVFSFYHGRGNYSALLFCIYLITPLVIKKFVER